ncbi:MAG: large-conductance mechanosensitive channel protein MscL [Treponema sp.]|nr:large-conductance mechanosensitive channel protein MscL [Treponema sp.]
MNENSNQNKFSLKGGFSAVGKEASAFKKFISRGNVVDMAVGVIIGGAFGKIVSSLVNDIIMPLIGVLIGGIDFSNLSITLGEATINYGVFIQTIIDFLIVAICIFAVIRVFEKFKKKEVEEQKDEAIIKTDEVLLLEEIRDILKTK